MRHRSLVVLALLATVTACHLPSLRSRAKSLGAGIASLGAKTVAIVKPLAPQIHIDARVQAIATDTAKDMLRAQVNKRLASQEPIVIGKSMHREPAPQRHQQQQQAPAEVPVTIHRTQAPPSVFVLHGVTFGGKAVCEQFTAMDVCTSSCTRSLQANAWNPKASENPNSMKSCSCLELDGGC